MKYLFILLLIPTISFSQQLSTNIGNYIELFEDDSLKVYFNCLGGICKRDCAEYYRVGSLDSIEVNFNGNVRDYFPDGKIAFTSTIENNVLTGEAKSFYHNGQLKNTGNYKDDIRVGVWYNYYENGQLKSIINYIKGFPYVSEYYSKMGKQLVKNGSGEYIYYYYKYKTCSQYKSWGKVLNGKFDGKWVIFDPTQKIRIGTEVFNNGAFSFGRSGLYKYEDRSKIEFYSFNPHENILLFENFTACPGDHGVFHLKYKNENLHSVFYNELADSVKKALSKNVLNQWLIIGITVADDDTISKILVYSSINDKEIELLVKDIIEDHNFFTAAKINSTPTTETKLFSLMIRNNSILIPTQIVYEDY